MANRPWLDDVRRRLADARLPSDYIRRFMDELADHFDDVMEESMDTNGFGKNAAGQKEANLAARLGQPGDVADAAIDEYRRRRLFVRHPWAKFWVFGVSPFAAALGAFVLVCLGVAALGEICDQCGVRLGDQNHLGGVDPAALIWGFSLITTILPITLLTVVYVCFARRSEVGRAWILASCCVLALTAMLPFQSVALSETPGESLWTIGLSLPPGLTQCVQLLVPLTVGLWLARRPGRSLPPRNELRAAA